MTCSDSESAGSSSSHPCEQPQYPPSRAGRVEHLQLVRVARPLLPRDPRGVDGHDAPLGDGARVVSHHQATEHSRGQLPNPAEAGVRIGTTLDSAVEPLLVVHACSIAPAGDDHDWTRQMSHRDVAS